jgi:hypothetical protein
LSAQVEVRSILQSGFIKIEILCQPGLSSDQWQAIDDLTRSEFKALLRMPMRGEVAAETEFFSAFATVSAKILQGLGAYRCRLVVKLFKTN